MNLIFMGTPDIAIPSLQALIDFPKGTVQAVYTQPDRLVGRKKQLTPSPVKAYAETRGIPVKTPEKARKKTVLEELREYAPDLIIVCAYGQILSQTLIDIPTRGCFNLHFSFLPRWRGASPVHAAIRAGDSVTGVSLQKVVKKLDAGDIVAASLKEPIQPDDTYETLVERLSRMSGELLTQTLPQLCDGSIEAHAQNEAEITQCQTIKKEEGLIDWQKETAIEIERKRRAFTPWPGIFTFEPNGKRLQLTAVEVVEESVLPPGKVHAGLLVGTQQGALRVLSLKPEGKKEMQANDFLRGRPDFIGIQLQ